MSRRNGDRARFNRLRKRKGLVRRRARELRKLMGSNAKGADGNAPAAITPLVTEPSI